MPIFEDYFKKHNIQKWQQAKDAKPNIKPGMTDDMSALYDDIAQVSKKKMFVFTNNCLNNSSRKQKMVTMSSDVVFVLKS